MPGSISVDSTTGTVKVDFDDDHGDEDAAAPAAITQVVFSSDNEAVLTVVTDPSNLFQGDITPVAEGTANISVVMHNVEGQPVLEPDGVTEFAAAPIAVTIVAGQAVGASLVISST